MLIVAISEELSLLTVAAMKSVRAVRWWELPPYLTPLLIWPWRIDLMLKQSKGSRVRRDRARGDMAGAGIDTVGNWWLPHTPEHVVAGRLVFNSAGGSLDLSGTLETQARRRLPRAYPIVQGRHGSKIFTLIDTFVSKRSGIGAGSEVEELAVNGVVVGAWFESLDDLQADRSTVELRHLTRFVGGTGIDVTYPFAGGTGDDWAQVLTRRQPRLQVTTAGPHFELVHLIDQTGDNVDDFEFHQKWVSRLELNELRPFQTHANIVSDFQDLITIAAGRPASIESFELEHPEVPLQTLAGTNVGDERDPFEYHVRWTSAAEPMQVREHEYFFNLDEMGGPAALGRWMTVARTYRSELGRVMSTRYSPSMYLEDRIANMCAALESLHQTAGLEPRSRQVTLVDRIVGCAETAGDEFTTWLPTDVATWAEHVKDLRHDLAHHRERMRLRTSPIDHPTSERLFWLIVFTFLRLAEVDEGAFERIGRSGQFRWLGEQA